MLQNVAVPLNGDIDAIKKYAEEMQKIKKQVSVDFPLETTWLSDTSACAAIQSELYNMVFCAGWSPGPCRGCRCKNGV